MSKCDHAMMRFDVRSRQSHATGSVRTQSRMMRVMAKGTRITMTNSQAESPSGRALIDLILAMCHDGMLSISEVEGLHIFLRREAADIPAFLFLRALTRDIVADGWIDDTEAYHLKKAFERVVPKEVRGVVSTHLDDIGVPTMAEDEAEPRWTRDPATARQIDYIIALGGQVEEGMTKGEASKMIDALLDRRPPTPRQVMLLRFFDRVDLQSSDKESVSIWIDEVFARNLEYEQAWARFKRDSNHDPNGQDPTVVPIGAYVEYIRRVASEVPVKPRSRTGCLMCISIAIGSFLAFAWVTGKTLAN